MYNASLYNAIPYNLLVQVSLYFHYLYDGSYREQPYPSNRVLVIGRDSDGNPVTGADEDTAELALVGERLALRYQPDITTAALAAQAADAALERARLQARAGFVTLPPNCGAELWDVISIQDSLCSQNPRSYRVCGIRLSYHPQHQLYIQQLLLGEV